MPVKVKLATDGVGMLLTLCIKHVLYRECVQ